MDILSKRILNILIAVNSEIIDFRGSTVLRVVCAIVAVILFVSNSSGTEENDLWLLISSYEDIGTTVKDLAFFLETHGYNADPHDTYVTVKFSSGKEVYLTPNGASPGLADLWMTPPTQRSGPVRIIPNDAIKKNVTYSKAINPDFIKGVTRATIFPVAPLGMCFEGSQQAAKIYSSFGYNITYMYDPSAGGYTQGHLWVAVEDKDPHQKWLAVDSYYGVMTDDEYYKAPYSFNDIKYLDSINPSWKVS
jgi:hypothetical protein